MLERFINTVKDLPKVRVEINPEFKERVENAKKEDKKLSQKIYGSGTILFISDRLYFIIRFRKTK